MKDKTKKASGLMKIESAAEFLELSRSTIYRLMDEGKLPSKKIGRSRRIPRRAIEVFAEVRA